MTGVAGNVGSTSSYAYTGTGSNDSITGSSYGDWLVGGAVADKLTGDAGSDRFLFSPGDSGQAQATIDTIMDSKKGAVGIGDLID